MSTTSAHAPVVAAPSTPPTTEAPPFALGYGTNGFADHPLDAALGVVAACGYSAVALTLGHPHLDPFADDAERRCEVLRTRCAEMGLRVVVETGARYLLDPWTKHRPTLVDDDARPRMQLLERATRLAAVLGADCVSLWSGVLPDGVPPEEGRRRLHERLSRAIDAAAPHGVPLSLEPEPGMLVQTLDDALAVRMRLGLPALAPGPLGITLDLGHCVAVEGDPVADVVRRAGPLLLDVQVDDMRPGVHEHLELGHGDLDLAAALAALAEVGYRGVAAVELPRHSHDAPGLALRSMAALEQAWRSGRGRGVGRSPVPVASLAARALGRAGSPAAVDGSKGCAWLERGLQRVREDPAAVHVLFPAAGRATGRASGEDPGVLAPEDAARAALVVELGDAVGPAALAQELRTLSDHGDAAERRGVLRGLDALASPTADAAEVAAVARELLGEALRGNDLRLVAAALGPAGARWLDEHAWRHAVLKALFVGVPLAHVADLGARRDPELMRMLSAYVDERAAAGRDVPADALDLLAGRVRPAAPGTDPRGT